MAQSQLDMAATRQFSISVDVNTPVDRVFEVMADTERWHEWTPSVTSIKRLDDGAFAVGSRAVIRQPKLPPALWTITAIDAGTKLYVGKQGARHQGDRAPFRRTDPRRQQGDAVTCATKACSRDCWRA